MDGAIIYGGVLNAAGQGLNTALEDGAVLGWHVQEHGLHPDTLRSFEKERIPRISKIAEQEQVCFSILLFVLTGALCLPAKADTPVSCFSWVQMARWMARCGPHELSFPISCPTQMCSTGLSPCALVIGLLCSQACLQKQHAAKRFHATFSQ